VIRSPNCVYGDLVSCCTVDNSLSSSVWQFCMNRMVTKIELLIVFACIAFTSGTGDEVVGPPEPPPPSSTSTTVSPPTPTTTSANTTTPSTTTSTTIKTTTNDPTSTTTTSTTTAVPTTPAPAPKPDTGRWNVTENSGNKTYILAEMAVQLNITYDTVEKGTQPAIVNIPQNANASGIFGNLTQSLNITWLNNDNVTNQFIIRFEKNDTTNRYMITNITMSVTPTEDEFPGFKDNATIILYNNKTEFSTPLHKSYHCAKEQTFDLMKRGNNITSGAVTLSHVKLEAFREKRDYVFDTAEDCEKSSSSDVVPIAVGCALVGLVAIVLIAYLVGRRRSQTRGYLSM